MFLAIFEPPILPVSFIYILGMLTVVLLLMKYGRIIPLKLGYDSHILRLLKFLFVMLAYLMIVNIVDVVFIERADLLSNRIRCVNQLVILSFIEFIAIWYIFCLADELHYRIADILRTISICGAVQGLCAVAAYISPVIRSIFIKFADSELFNNAYFIERRGYGFSMTLIDTFGYGMGLIAGYIILQKRDNKSIWRIIALALTVFAIFVNARTGLVIIIIAVVLKITQGENKAQQVAKIAIAVPIVYLVVKNFIPAILQNGIRSGNITVKWVSQDMLELYSTLLYGNKAGNSLTEVSFLSDFGHLPDNAFEFIFGSGHSIYDTSSILGFRTDIGYINLWWEFGVIGMLLLLIGMFIWMVKPLKVIRDKNIRSIIFLNVISYFVVLFKAILIGYNPGIFINYLMTFSIYYFCYKSKVEMLK